MKKTKIALTLLAFCVASTTWATEAQENTPKPMTLRDFLLPNEPDTPWKPIRPLDINWTKLVTNTEASLFFPNVYPDKEGHPHAGLTLLAGEYSGKNLNHDEGDTNNHSGSYEPPPLIIPTHSDDSDTMDPRSGVVTNVDEAMIPPMPPVPTLLSTGSPVTNPDDSDMPSSSPASDDSNPENEISSESHGLKELGKLPEMQSFNYVQLNEQEIKLGKATFDDKGEHDEVNVHVHDGMVYARNGFDAGGSQIHHVNDGVDDFDAVNVRQLRRAIEGINLSTKKLNAGVAQAIAAAGLPQASGTGKSMIAGSLGTYRSEKAFAIGFSHVTDDNRKVIKVNGSGDTRGYFGMSVGAGYQW